MADDTDLATVLQDLHPVLQKTRKKGFALCGLIFVAAVAVGFFVASISAELILVQWGMVAASGAFATVLVHLWVKNLQKPLIMPHVAKAVGFTYSKDAKPFQSEIPRRLLPRSDNKKYEDMVTATFAGRTIRMAKACHMTVEQRSKDLFRGVVIEISNLTPLPVFCMAIKDATNGHFLSRPVIDVTDLVLADDPVLYDDWFFDVWVRPVHAELGQAALQDVVAVLRSLNTYWGGDAELYSIISDGAKTYIAMRNRGDLFSVGGLFVGRKDTLNQVKKSLTDFQFPLKVLELVIEAERITVRSENGKPPEDLPIS